MATVSQLAPSVPAPVRQFIFMKTPTPPSRGAPDETLCQSPEPTVSFFQDPLCLANIVVPLDLSLESLRALDFALTLAKRFSARLHLVHVLAGEHRFATVTTSPLLWSQAEAERHLADEVELIFGTRPRAEDCHLRLGPPPREIVAAARELRADLIVIATHGRSGWRHLTLGSTTEKVIRSANCPVLVVREELPGPIRKIEEGIVLQKILVPVDFSECARDGARYASVFATAVGADLLLLHVVRPRSHQIEESKGAAQHWSQELKDAVLDAEDQLDTLVNSLPLVGIKAETEVEVGVPAEKLARASRRAEVDLIITSTHGYSGLRHALLGSVAEELGREAGCPVLIVPSHLRKG